MCCELYVRTDLLHLSFANVVIARLICGFGSLRDWSSKSVAISFGNCDAVSICDLLLVDIDLRIWCFRLVASGVLAHVNSRMLALPCSVALLVFANSI